MCIPAARERNGCCRWRVWGAIRHPVGVHGLLLPRAAGGQGWARAGPSGPSSPSESVESTSRHGLTPGLLRGGRRWLCQHAQSRLRSTRQGWGVLHPLHCSWWLLGQLWLVLGHAVTSGHASWSHPVCFYLPTASCSLPKLGDDLSQTPGELRWPVFFYHQVHSLVTHLLLMELLSIHSTASKPIKSDDLKQKWEWSTRGKNKCRSHRLIHFIILLKARDRWLYSNESASELITTQQH